MTLVPGDVTQNKKDVRKTASDAIIMLELLLK
jgi:hypothetical protein